jgi:hypothetical protein
MEDSEFLSWLKERLINVYGESPNVDFVLRLGEIVKYAKMREEEIKRNPMIDGNGRF